MISLFPLQWIALIVAAVGFGVFVGWMWRERKHDTQRLSKKQ